MIFLTGNLEYLRDNITANKIAKYLLDFCNSHVKFAEKCLPDDLGKKRTEKLHNSLCKKNP